MCDTCSKFSFTIQTEKFKTHQEQGLNKHSRAEKAESDTSEGRILFVPGRILSGRWKPPCWEGLRLSGLTIQGKNPWFEESYQRGWIPYPNGFPIPVDSLSQRIPWGCCAGFFVIFFIVFLWVFFLEWGVLLLFFLRSKEKSEFCPRKFPGFDNKAASTAAV